MKSRHLFPALRCRMDDWMYYVTYFTFDDISGWIKKTDEIHKSKKLSDWIQRRLNSKHTDKIEKYLLSQEDERFFNSIVVGIYGGKPRWAPLKVSAPADMDLLITEEEEIELEQSIGLLRFSGEEKLFAIDGQHRVAGIKKALKKSPKLGSEEICTIFVGHEETDEGRPRTRRLFTTLNKEAKKVSQADIIALDEDNSFAVVTRMPVDDFSLFEEGENVAFSGSSSIPKTDFKSITSVIGIYEITQDLYLSGRISGLPKKTEAKNMRLSDKEIQKVYKTNCDYWNTLVELVPEYKEVFNSNAAKPGDLRRPDNNHLLFRPAGQRAFAGATQILISRDFSMKNAVENLLSVDLWLQKKHWHHILWDPIQERMLAKNRSVAETFLLQSIDQKGRSSKHESRLQEILDSR